MNEFDQEEVKSCMYALSKAGDPSDSVFAWTLLQRKHPGLSAMVALDNYDKAVMPPWLRKYSAQPNNYLVPYFSTEKMYFLDDELLSEMFSSDEEFKFRIDYTLMFDTNIATYVNKLVRGESLGNIQSRVVALVDDILHDDLNFDHLFYMAENVKNVRYSGALTARSTKEHPTHAPSSLTGRRHATPLTSPMTSTLQRLGKTTFLILCSYKR